MQMPRPVIVVHYHELWLKGRNRNFFLGKLAIALRRALEGIAFTKIGRPGDRMIVELGEGAPVAEALARLARVSGISSYAVARTISRRPEAALEAICDAAWQEVEPDKFATFAVRAKRSDKTFAASSLEIEKIVGRHLRSEERRVGKDVRVHLDDPELTSRIEITPGPVLVYARRIPGSGGLPANSGGPRMCVLSGGFESRRAAPEAGE